jgi:ubiquinone/menaquinone biosynthesis C-methylase UbiE
VNGFDVPAESYDAFMGRYSRHLSAQLADLAGVEAGQHVLDVGSGPGALTVELARRLGPEAVTAVDPSDEFVLAVRSRVPGTTVVRGSAESLPLPDGAFDAALAQLVVHFMADPVAGLREMARVTRAGGAVAACVWDHSAGGSGPLSLYYEALHEVDPSRPAELQRPGTRPGHLAELFAAAGFDELEEATLTARVEHETFEDWWAPYELGVGTTAGVFAELGPERVARLRELCREALPPPPFTIEARAWAVCSRA